MSSFTDKLAQEILTKKQQEEKRLKIKDAEALIVKMQAEELKLQKENTDLTASNRIGKLELQKRLSSVLGMHGLTAGWTGHDVVIYQNAKVLDIFTMNNGIWVNAKCDKVAFQNEQTHLFYAQRVPNIYAALKK